jgi:hypothetical protein
MSVLPSLRCDSENLSAPALPLRWPPENLSIASLWCDLENLSVRPALPVPPPSAGFFFLSTGPAGSELCKTAGQIGVRQGPRSQTVRWHPTSSSPAAPS